MSNAHGIQKLSDYQHLRLRTEMYLGSRTSHHQNVLIHTPTGPTVHGLSWVPALMTSFREIVDNSLDEFTKAGIAGILTVDYDESNLKFVISDNGRGIPIDWDETHQCHLATLVMSELKAGRNFDDNDRKGVAGMNGLGGSAITNVSKEFEVEVIRRGKPKIDGVQKREDTFMFTQRFFEGNKAVDDSLQICSPVIKKTTSTKTGTTIRFTLSRDVFKNDNLPTNLVESLLREIAAVNFQHTIKFNGVKLPTRPSVEKTLFANNNSFTLSINEEGFKSKFYVVPNMVSPDHGLVAHSLVNNIPTYDGGNHLDTFKREFALRLIRILTPQSKRRKLNPNRSDIEEGILIYNVTVMDGPYFQSQAKSKLINDNVIKPIDKAMSDDWFNEVIKKNKDWIEEIYQRCADRTNKKDADELARAAKKNLKNKVAKLRDATGRDGKVTVLRKHCTLFITEGDCIHDKEEVYVLRDGQFVHVKANELVIGDIVVTDKHNLKPIIGITKKVKPVKLIKTNNGDIRVTEDHRLYVLDKTDTFCYKRVKDIIPGVDRLVRSQIVDHDVIDPVVVVRHTNDDMYPLYIELASGAYQKCTYAHHYGVFDFEDGKFVVIPASEIQVERHAMLAKK